MATLPRNRLPSSNPRRRNVISPESTNQTLGVIKAAHLCTSLGVELGGTKWSMAEETVKHHVESEFFVATNTITDSDNP
jgi:hypothetical protein